MKNLILKNPLVSIIVVVCLFVLGGFVLSLDKNVIQPAVENAISTSTDTKTGTNQPVGTKTNTSTVKPSYTTSLPITVSKAVNEDEYIRQLLQNQRTCEQMAEKQFDAMYSSVLSSTNFDNHYTSSNGQCYMEVFGKTYDKYATSSIGHLYFRDVLRNSLLIECTSPTGGLVSNPQWSCAVKSSGKKIDKFMYDELVNTYLTK